MSHEALAQHSSLKLRLETPTDADIEKGTYELQIAQDRRGCLDRELEDTQARLKTLESERQEVLDDISYWSSFVTRFRPLRIPAEILSEIFRIYVIEDGGSPWRLTQVSRAFRATALGTPRIWGGITLWGGDRISFGLYTRPTTSGARWEFGKENCFNAKQLRQALKRAKAAPLDLTINCTRGYSMNVDDRGKELIAMVGGERLSQWRSLEFAVEDNWDLSDMCSGSLEGLTFLRLNTFHRDLYDCLCKTARNLRNVEIHMLNQLLSELTDAPWWQHVHRLLLVISLRRVGSVGQSTLRTIQCDSAVDILSKAVELEDLNIQFEHYIEFTPIQKHLHFSRMKKLILKSSAGLLPNISAPLLTHLEIQSGGWGSEATFNPGSISFPAVTHLSVLSCAAPVLASFYCPSLVQLCLGAHSAGGASKYNNDLMVTSAWSPDNDPSKHLKPSILKIKGLAFTWTVLRDLLGFSLHDCLRELSLNDCPLPKSFFKALMVVTPPSVICEDLEKLSVMYSSDLDKMPRIMGWHDGKAVLKSIFTLRREQNLGLRRVIAQRQWPWMSRLEFGDIELGMSEVSAGGA